MKRQVEYRQRRRRRRRWQRRSFARGWVFCVVAAVAVRWHSMESVSSTDSKPFFRACDNFFSISRLFRLSRLLREAWQQNYIFFSFSAPPIYIFNVWTILCEALIRGSKGLCMLRCWTDSYASYHWPLAIYCERNKFDRKFLNWLECGVSAHLSTVNFFRATHSMRNEWNRVRVEWQIM